MEWVKVKHKSGNTIVTVNVIIYSKGKKVWIFLIIIKSTNDWLNPNNPPLIQIDSKF